MKFLGKICPCSKESLEDGSDKTGSTDKTALIRLKNLKCISQRKKNNLELKSGLGSRSRSETGVFGSLEPEPEPLEKKQEPEPEPLGEKVRSRSC